MVMRKNRPMRAIRIVLRVAGVLLLVHVLALTAMYFFQEKLIFHAPPKLDKDYKFSYTEAFEEVYIPVSGHVSLHGLLFQSAGPSKGLVFYLHGNGGSLEGWGYMSNVYTRLGYDLFVLDYRGYGKSGGKIESMPQFLDDMNNAYRFMAKRYPERDIVVAGFSMGTGPSAYIGANNHPKMLILQAPYFTLADETLDRFPFAPAFLLRYNFDTNAYLKKVECPVYMFHGTNDRVLAYENSARLKKENPKVNFYTIKGLGHTRFNDDSEYQRLLSQILLTDFLHEFHQQRNPKPEKRDEGERIPQA